MAFAEHRRKAARGRSWSRLRRSIITQHVSAHNHLGILLGIQRYHWDASSSPSGRLGATVCYHSRFHGDSFPQELIWAAKTLCFAMPQRVPWWLFSTETYLGRANAVSCDVPKGSMVTRGTPIPSPSLLGFHQCVRSCPGCITFTGSWDFPCCEKAGRWGHHSD